MTFAGHVGALRKGSYLHVVNYHWTSASTASRLEADLAAYQRHLDPVLPEHLEHFFATGRWPLRRPGFAPVFYDAYREHATVAAPVCEALGLVGWFLPPTGLVDCPVAEQRDFCERNDVDLPDEQPGDGRIALTWAELEQIGRRHVLGAHTASHAVPDDVLDDAAVERELVAPRRALERCAGTAPVVLAWREGRPDDPGHPAFAALRATGYRLLVSATRVQRVRA